MIISNLISVFEVYTQEFPNSPVFVSGKVIEKFYNNGEINSEENILYKIKNIENNTQRKSLIFNLSFMGDEKITLNEFISNIKVFSNMSLKLEIKMLGYFSTIFDSVILDKYEEDPSGYKIIIKFSDIFIFRPKVVTFKWPSGIYGPLIGDHPVNKEIHKYETEFILGKRKWSLYEVDKLLFEGIQKASLTPAQHWALKIMKCQAMSGLMA